MEPTAGSSTNLDLRSVHSLTTYDLRQELVRRGLDVEKELDGHVNYDTMLKKMVQLLIEEADRQANGPADTSTEDRERSRLEEAAKVQEELQRKKEQRKKEAIERSLKRQADRQYFRAKEEANKKAQEERLLRGNGSQNASDEGIGDVEMPISSADNNFVLPGEGENHLEEEGESSNRSIFGSSHRKQQFKVFVR